MEWIRLTAEMVKLTIQRMIEMKKQAKMKAVMAEIE